MTIEAVKNAVNGTKPWRGKIEPVAVNGHDRIGDDTSKLFRVVDMAQAEREDDHAWYWAGYLPSMHVTMLGGHGGAGKSTFATHLAACIGMGADAFGFPTKRARVLYFSGEDPAPLGLKRLRRICRRLGLPFDEVCQWLQIIDASDLHPVLFTERRLDGTRHGVTTPTYAALAEYIKREGFEVLIVDNASDTFDADEINRAMVRAFIRSLKQLVPSTGAVLLLAHVDKNTSRAGRQGNPEAYSGSTAWHNSVRSRLFLMETSPGMLELQHQKSNLGPKHSPMTLEWPQDGVMQTTETSGFVAAIQSKSEVKALLQLIHEYAGRGEYVHPKHNSQNSAGKLFAEEKTYPKGMKPAAASALLRDAERDGWIVREVYRGPDRKQHERLSLTPAGCDAIGVVPSAPSAQSTEVGAL